MGRVERMGMRTTMPPVVVDEEGLLKEQEEREGQGESGGADVGLGEDERVENGGKGEVEVGALTGKRKRKVVGRVVGAEGDDEVEPQGKTGEDKKSRKVDGVADASKKMGEKKKAKVKGKSKKGGGLSFAIDEDEDG